MAHRGAGRGRRGRRGALSDIFDALTGSVSAFETREGKPAEWLVETYAATALVDAALDLRLTLAATAAGGKILDLIEMPVAERDWLAENRRAFPPQRIGRFFIHGSHWRERPPAGAIAVEIDAASAFGTGEHPSTRGCLLAFDRLARRRRFRLVRDVGTGSGILAIAAAKALRRKVSGERYRSGSGAGGAAPRAAQRAGWAGAGRVQGRRERPTATIWSSPISWRGR